MRKTIAAIVVTGVYLLTNLLSGEAAGPVETYQGWSDELKSYTQSVCDEYNVDYSLALNEVNFDYLNKTLGVRSMSELLDDRTGIRCGVQLLAYHKQYTGNDSAALLRYQIGAGKYKQYLRKGRYTNQTHQQVLTYQSELASYMNSLQ